MAWMKLRKQRDHRPSTRTQGGALVGFRLGLTSDVKRMCRGYGLQADAGLKKRRARAVATGMEQARALRVSALTRRLCRSLRD